MAVNFRSASLRRTRLRRAELPLRSASKMLATPDSRCHNQGHALSQRLFLGSTPFLATHHRHKSSPQLGASPIPSAPCLRRSPHLHTSLVQQSKYCGLTAGKDQGTTAGVRICCHKFCTSYKPFLAARPNPSFQRTPRKKRARPLNSNVVRHLLYGHNAP